MSIDLRYDPVPLKRLIESVSGSPNFSVEGIYVRRIQTDSRKVEEGDLFVAIVGEKSDGHRFVPEAIEKGAVAAVVEWAGDENSRLVVVPDTRVALAILAKEFFDKPDEELKLAGITGTNGKTTVTHMIQSEAKANRIDFGVIGTLGYAIREKHGDLSLTTPDPVVLFGILRKMSDEGISGVAMEVSSHSLSQKRVLGLKFLVAAFTNLTMDHLDYHGDMESYFEAKKTLFDTLDSDAISVICIDDPYGKRLIGSLSGKKSLTYGIRERADIYADGIRCSSEGTRFELHSPIGSHEIALRVPGDFNVLNALCAVGVGIALGWDLGAMAGGLSLFEGIPGRFELVRGCQPFSIYIDYSHTPDSLMRAILACKEISKGKVIVVFGAGGDRDQTKRPKMGAIAGELADIVILTNDNPRTEDPAKIIDQIEEGIPKYANKFRIEDRKSAIHKALELAREEDVVLIAGKGHEDYQIIGTTKYHFNDKEVVLDWLEKRGYRR